MAASYYSSLQWVVDSIDRHTNPGMEDLSLGLGGFQVQQATPMGGAFYIENVLNPLKEFFFSLTLIFK